VEAPITTRAALLQALRDGPGYGRELIRRVQHMSEGRVRLSEGRVYPVLKALEEEGLVGASEVVPRGRRGARSRTYYDLTLRGVEVSTLQREALHGLVMRRREAERREEWDLEAMGRRVLEAEELAEFGGDLRAAMMARRR